jgi:hypothetical protein
MSNNRLQVRRSHKEASRVTLTLDVQQQQVVQKLRDCRIIIGVDVSGSMEDLIKAVIRGIKNINSVLKDGDLVSIVYVINSPFSYRYLPQRMNWIWYWHSN